jgi:N-formylglutamate amidohydrolase
MTALALRPAFEIVRPVAGPAGPVVFASPHSGRHYPADLLAASALDDLALRRSEDAYVDRLIAAAAGHGITTLKACMARAYVDVNREADELDPDMFSDAHPGMPRSLTARVAAGLGAIPRIVAEGQEIYDRKLSLAEARGRLEAVYVPYHQALDQLLAETRAAHGLAILIDWHSMPAIAARTPGGSCDLVLGDRFGVSCANQLTRQLERSFGELGYRVARNAPYAGGYTTEHYGRPGLQIHALQIEINRSLYMDEASLELSAGFERLVMDLDEVMRGLTATNWSEIAS